MATSFLPVSTTVPQRSPEGSQEPPAASISESRREDSTERVLAHKGFVHACAFYCHRAGGTELPQGCGDRSEGLGPASFSRSTQQTLAAVFTVVAVITLAL